MASSFANLRDFIRKRMRMLHIYQPVMIRVLLVNSGKASLRNIAAAFIARDASQLEYYEQITKDMPGKVLSKHGIVQRDGDEYSSPLIRPRCLRKSATSLFGSATKRSAPTCKNVGRLSTITAEPLWATSREVCVRSPQARWVPL
jgi:hypothetical protein